MPGPRKVRVFRDRKKSPNWYVEWRDLQGRKHCESCGARKGDAEERARRIEAEFRHLRQASADSPIGERSLESHRIPIEPSPPPTGSETAVVQFRAFLRCANVELPVDLLVEMKPELVRTIQQAIAQANRG